MFDNLKKAFSNVSTGFSEKDLNEKDIEDVLFQSEINLLESDVATEVIDSIKVGLLEKLIREIDENIIQKVLTFDVFEGENIPKDKKSVAINVTLQVLDKTLSEKDLDQVSQKIIEAVKEKTGATIRS